jgi:branched-chain amino acid transport system permease protein
MMEGRVTLSGRPDLEPRGDPRCLFRSSGMIWVDTIIQGILLGGLYALFAAGSVAGLRHHAAGEPRPWRPHRDGRLSDPASGDASGLSPFLAAAIAMPFMFASATDCRAHAQPRRWARTSCRRFWSPSVCRWCCRTRLLEGFSADSQRLHFGALSTASIEVAGLNLGVCRS